MTSFAFIFGLFPLWNALGAGGKARQLIGTVTITGMIFSSAFAIFLVRCSSSLSSGSPAGYAAIGARLRRHLKIGYPRKPAA